MSDSPNCVNHADIVAADRCGGCSEPFCGDCLVAVGGKRYCGGCKILALQGGQAPPPAEAMMIPCKDADEALKYALVGIICFGIILEPVAIAKALSAKKQIAADPSLTGEGKAQAALIIGCVMLVLWMIGIAARISNA